MSCNQVIFAFVVQLMTSVVDAVVQTTAMTPFTAVKTVLGDYVCAIYPVAMTTILSISVLQCSFECQRLNSCGGFNFRDNGNICEQISASNVTFGVKQGCRYFTRGVGIAPVGSYGTNVALGATAIQYSTYSTYYASLAVDGSLATKSGTQTTNLDTGIYHWWAVDLGYQRHVNVVQVAGDAWTVEPFRLDNFYVLLSNTQPAVGQPLNTAANCTLCLQFQGRVQENSQIFMPCPAVLPSFRYVIIQSSLVTYAINLIEIQVFIN